MRLGQCAVSYSFSMIRFASSKVNGSISFRARRGSSSGSAGFFSIKPSATAAFRIVEIRTMALRFTPGEVHSVAERMRRSAVVVIRSIRVSARCGIQYRFRQLL
ncbi:hypothetical protein FQZ97_888420 [compost metagenome]